MWSHYQAAIFLAPDRACNSRRVQALLTLPARGEPRTPNCTPASLSPQLQRLATSSSIGFFIPRKTLLGALLTTAQQPTGWHTSLPSLGQSLSIFNCSSNTPTNRSHNYTIRCLTASLFPSPAHNGRFRTSSTAEVHPTPFGVKKIQRQDPHATLHERSQFRLCLGGNLHRILSMALLRSAGAY